MRRRGEASEERPAPRTLRRRVIASVRGEPAPPGELARALRRRLGGASLAWATGLVLVASGALALALVQASRRDARGETGLVASSLDGAHATLARAGRSVELTLTGMPVLPAPKTYEIWMLDGDGRLRALSDMFGVTSAGRASVELPGDLVDVRELLVTREPIGGSEMPAGPPLLEILNPSALAR
jgi:anti-sigma-K factor RskA